MKKLTKEEAAELNELFETSNFKPEMSGLSLFILFINKAFTGKIKSLNPMFPKD